MRLIDADDLKRSFNKLCDRFGEDFHISAIETEIDAAQTVDAVEVVRCNDCKYRHSSEECECRLPDAFCSNGRVEDCNDIRCRCRSCRWRKKP